MSKVKEKEVYTIQLLEDKEFENLHKQMPHVNKESLKEALGFADSGAGDCYIRKTGVKDWDMATIQHEIQELVSKESFHEDANGIRWKRKGAFTPFFKFAPREATEFVQKAVPREFKKALPDVATAVGFALGGPKGAAIGRAGGKMISQELQGEPIKGREVVEAGIKGYAYGSAAKAGVGGVKGLVGGIQAAPPEAGALGRIGGGIKGAATGALGITPKPAPGTQSATELAKAGYGAGTPVGTTPMGGWSKFPEGYLGSTNYPTIGGVLGTTTLTGLQKPVTTVGAPAVGLPAAPGVTPTGVAPAAPVTPIPPAPTGLGAIAKRLATPEGILGMGTMLAGAATPTPEFEMPPRIAELEQAFMTQRGLSEVGQVARGQLLETMKARPEDLFAPADDAFIQASLRGTRESYERAQEQLDAQYNRAGVYGSGEHLAAQDNLREELAQLESDFIALENDRRFTMAQESKRQAVVVALQDAGLTEKNIMDIAAMDVWAAAQQFGAEVKDMQVIKDALSGIGSELLGGAFKKPEETEIEGQ